MPDGTRKRRFSPNPAKRQYYHDSRSIRFKNRYSLEKPNK